jgi:hypothetical protein
VLKKNTRQRASLPSVKLSSVIFLTLGKELLRRVFSFTEGFLRGTRQRAYLPSAQKNTRQNIWYSTKNQVPIVFAECRTRQSPSLGKACAAANCKACAAAEPNGSGTCVSFAQEIVLRRAAAVWRVWPHFADAKPIVGLGPTFNVGQINKT